MQQEQQTEWQNEQQQQKKVTTYIENNPIDQNSPSSSLICYRTQTPSKVLSYLLQQKSNLLH